jgi:hypothetical protein
MQDSHVENTVIDQVRDDMMTEFLWRNNREEQNTYIKGIKIFISVSNA